MQSFDVFGKHLTTSDLFQNCDGKDTCDKPYTYDICGKGLRLFSFQIFLKKYFININ
jgi:hypothetical protein